MSHNRFRGILCSLINLRISGGVVTTLLLLGSVGCSGEPGADDLSEIMKQNPPHHLAATNREIEILTVEPDGDQQWKIQFECQETPEEDWLLKLDLAQESKQDKAEEAKYQAALQAHQQLRAPESQGLDKLKQEIERFPFPPLFQQVYRKGTPVKWSATAVVDQSGEKPKLTVSDLKLSDGRSLKNLIAKSAMPKEAVLADGGPLDPLRQFTELRQKLITSVVQAKQTMEQRLKAEQQALVSLVQQPMAVAGKLFPAQTESEEVTLLFEPGTANTFSAVAIDANDTLSRVVFNGALYLPPVEAADSRLFRRVHDGWMLVLKNEDSSLSKMARKIRENRIVYYDKANNRFHLSDSRRATPLQPAAASSASQSVSQKELAQAITEGTQFKGSESITGQADRAVVMSITKFEPETGNVRVVIEDAQTPFTFAVFEGKLQREAPHHLGIPVRLEQVTSHSHPSQQRPKTGLFSRKSGSNLLLIPTEKGFVGRFAQTDVNVEKISGETEIVSADQRWQNTLVPGYAWRGVTKWGDEAVKRATLRVAEIRDQGKYVRLTLERDNDPVQQVVYEGSLVTEDGRIDGYGLVTQQFGTASIYEHDYFGVFFSRWQSEDKKVFRISPDGKKIYGLSKQGEVLTLERDPAVEKTDQLTTDERKQVWKKCLTVGKIWEGTIKSVKQKQTAEVKMIVRGYELDGKQVTLEFVPKVNRKAKTVFEGSLDTSDKGTNGFGLIAKKKLKFSGPGNVFGNWDTQLEFRLDASGKRILGRTNDHGDVEYLDLRLMETK
ncbi:hypothetical protein [Gimesia fumaroli]|uniref:Uncharacterized protein n=1 Tax=Gimesia fumaroli TaxID=2527976 RepID=A0A518IEU4_9PLAN|nr:hypothetical protein [Gimesia fumaroli]QDV51587.1 hypothetical protein Enr17x_36430 [Gimesia fumaroli]